MKRGKLKITKRKHRKKEGTLLQERPLFYLLLIAE